MGNKPLSTNACRLLLIAFLATLSASCASEDEGAKDEELGEPLVVLTRNAPTTYYIDRFGEAEGYEVRLAKHFGAYLNRPVEFKLYDSAGDLLDALRDGEGAIAAAGLTLTEKRSEEFLAGPSYRNIKEQVVCRRGGPNPDKPKEIAQVELVVAADTSYIDSLTALKEDHPELSWKVERRTGTEEILEEVWERDIECTVADSNIVAVNRRYYPELKVTYTFKDEQVFVWYFAEGQDDLRNLARDWRRKSETKKYLKQLEKRFYAYIPVFDYVDIRAYRRQIRKRLPKYMDEFEDAGEKYEIDPLILAAQAYQESHWEPKAKSPTGVRGIMMLTLSTAKRVGVDDRLDPEQSIDGGAKYLAELIDRLPDDVEQEDRLWFALAAYNIGMGHLYDARTLAERLGRNKNDWDDMEEIIPLLGHKEYYTTLRYGFARGHEAVRYVRRIRNYLDILHEALEA